MTVIDVDSSWIDKTVKDCIGSEKLRVLALDNISLITDSGVHHLFLDHAVKDFVETKETWAFVVCTARADQAEEVRGVFHWVFFEAAITNGIVTITWADSKFKPARNRLLPVVAQLLGQILLTALEK